MTKYTQDDIDKALEALKIALSEDGDAPSSAPAIFMVGGIMLSIQLRQAEAMEKQAEALDTIALSLMTLADTVGNVRVIDEQTYTGSELVGIDALTPTAFADAPKEPTTPVDTPQPAPLASLPPLANLPPPAASPATADPVVAHSPPCDHEYATKETGFGGVSVCVKCGFVKN